MQGEDSFPFSPYRAVDDDNDEPPRHSPVSYAPAMKTEVQRPSSVVSISDESSCESVAMKKPSNTSVANDQQNVKNQHTKSPGEDIKNHHQEASKSNVTEANRKRSADTPNDNEKLQDLHEDMTSNSSSAMDDITLQRKKMEENRTYHEISFDLKWEMFMLKKRKLESEEQRHQEMIQTITTVNSNIMKLLERLSEKWIYLIIYGFYRYHEVMLIFIFMFLSILKLNSHL